MALDEERGMLYVGNRGESTVSVVDLERSEAVATVPVGADPWGVAANTVTNKIYTINTRGISMSVIDGVTHEVTSTVPLGFFPGGIAVNPITNRIYVVSTYENDIRVFDGESNALLSRIPIGHGPSMNAHGIAIDPATNKVYVGGGTKVSIVDLATEATTTLDLGSHVAAVAVDTTSNMVYAAGYTAGAGVTVISGATDSVVGNIPTTQVGADLAVDSTRHLIYSKGDGREVEVLDGVTNTWVSKVKAGASNAGLVAHSQTGAIYASHNNRTVETLMAPSFVDSQVPAGIVDEYFAFDLQTVGSGEVRYALTEGVLPPGTSLDTYLGMVEGFPSTPGEYTFTVTADNGLRPVAAREVTISVLLAPALTSGRPTDATAGQRYEFALTASGSGPITFAVIDGALPEGLVLDVVTGRIHGAPSVEGRFDITVQAQNSVGEDTESYVLNVVAPTVVLPSPTPEPGLGTKPGTPELPTAGGGVISEPPLKLADSGGRGVNAWVALGALLLAAGAVFISAARRRRLVRAPGHVSTLQVRDREYRQR